MFIVKANLVSLSNRTPFPNQQREPNELHGGSQLTPPQSSPQTKTSLKIHHLFTTWLNTAHPRDAVPFRHRLHFPLAGLVKVFFEAMFLRVVLASYGTRGARCKLLILRTGITGGGCIGIIFVLNVCFSGAHLKASCVSKASGEKYLW